MTMPIIYAGNAPACDDRGCNEFPGYEKVGTDKCGDGACCVTGNKSKCQFNADIWKTSLEYNNLPQELKNQIGMSPQYEVRGTAPFCGAKACDLLKDGVYPVKKINFGGGARCVTGNKWLGIKIPNMSQFPDTQQAMLHCKEMEKLDKEAIIAGFQSVGNVANAAASFITGGASGAASNAIGDAVSGAANTLSSAANNLLDKGISAATGLVDKGLAAASNSVRNLFIKG